MIYRRRVMDEVSALSFDDLSAEAAVLGVYRQVFAVLAKEAGAMILDVSLVDVDEAILASFADVGTEGLTVEQVISACRQHGEARVRRRFEVLRDYGAVSRVNDRSNELYYRAAFAPYVMLLFLRRIAEKGGQSELHQLLTLEHVGVSSARATVADGRGTAQRLTTVFRLLANQLGSLAAGGVVETLRENAQLLWGNHALLDQALEVHRVVLTNWPELDRECQALRLAVAAYRDAVDAAAGRLIEQAGATRALGFLPVEAWRTFARRSELPALAGVLDRFTFDAPAPWFTTEALIEAVESGRHTSGTRIPPPRPNTDGAPADETTGTDHEADRLRELAEQLFGKRTVVTVAELLDEIGDWPAGRRLLADLTALHHHDDLPYELTWGDGLRINVESSLSWVAQGWFRRLDLGQAV
ncbi:hypothetical protein Nm8I071_56830 [Nonomuraea sp. TT08I-71]|nr:hypothetical protein Nm8I071_56830 [Nonomuraea sp. TT08I-71]